MSTLAWLDHSESDRRRMLAVIDLFRDQDTVDELGLAGAFVEGYETEVLAAVDIAAVVEPLKVARLPALLCVEADPHACHRSLAAAFLAGQVGTDVRHLRH